MNKSTIINFLKKIRIYKPLRKIYNIVGRYNKQTEIVINNNKLRFWTPTYYLNDYIKNLGGEKELLNEFLLRMSNENIFWDVGANVGLYSIVGALQMKIKGKVFAFEPERIVFKLLKKNIELNVKDNIIALPFALGENNEEKIFYSSDTPNFGAHSFVQRADYKLKKKGIYTKIKTSDTLIYEGIADIPTVIKIDVEGSEILVLRGMKNLLKDQKLKMIICEIHTNLLPLFNSSEVEVKEIIEQEGFRIDYCFNRKNQNQYIFIR